MDKNIECMLKCRAIFIRTTAVMLDGNYCYDDKFEYLLKNFFDSYVYLVEDVFKMIYDVRVDEEGNKYIYEDNDMRKLFLKYLRNSNSNHQLSIMCDEVGMEKVSIICDLAELFYGYVITIGEISNERNRILN